MVAKSLALEIAKAAGKTRYFTGVPCSRGHLCERMVSGRNCLMCLKIHGRKSYAKSEKMKAGQAKRSRAWYLANKEQSDAASRKWAANNPEQVNKRVMEWREKNPHALARIVAKRRAALKKAIAAWADFDKIDAIYSECKKLTLVSGIEHHVDHIIPLQGKTVSGLHVEDNLQILIGVENQSKGNRFVA